MNNFIERSIRGALSFLKESIFSDNLALNKGLLQSIDPRIKTISFLIFIILIIFIKNLSLLIALYLICLLLAGLSKINLRFFLKRTWIFIPLFSLFIAIPAIFSGVTAGRPLLTFGFLGLKLTITEQGLSGAILFVTRVLTNVSYVILLGQVSRHNELLRVLRIFGIPQVFVLAFGMCYRYIYLFIELIESAYLAVKSRVGYRLHYKRGQELIVWNIGNLWQRSNKLNEEIYSAMLSRGYSGEPRVLEEFRTKIKDWLWLFFVIIIFVLVFWLNYALKP